MVTITSLEDRNYNCIAWAAEEDDRWWWPTQGYYWSDGIPRVETLEAFIQAYGTLGYEICEEGSVEPEFQKIAIYVDKRGVPTHAARQLCNGFWASKLGSDVDVEHDTLEAVLQYSDCLIYGQVGMYLKRPADQGI